MIEPGPTGVTSSIPDDLGTAVTVQAMVFGNRGGDSGTGVLFTRNPATGEHDLYGDVMFKAQGEDVVAGTHKPDSLSALDERLPQAGAELRSYAAMLERHYRDLCDIEFTIERGKLWMLQVRVGKRSPRAALRMAVEMAEDPELPAHARRGGAPGRAPVPGQPAAGVRPRAGGHHAAHDRSSRLPRRRMPARSRPPPRRPRSPPTPAGP